MLQGNVKNEKAARFSDELSVFTHHQLGHHLSLLCLCDGAACLLNFTLKNMATAGKRVSFTFHHKLKVTDHAEYGNKSAARVFGPSPTEKDYTCLPKAKSTLKTSIKIKKKIYLRCPAPLGPDFEEDKKSGC